MFKIHRELKKLNIRKINIQIERKIGYYTKQRFLKMGSKNG